MHVQIGAALISALLQDRRRAAPEADSVRWVESRPPPDLPGDVLSLLDHHLLDLGTYGDPSADDRIPALLRREGGWDDQDLAEVDGCGKARRAPDFAALACPRRAGYS